jgi:ribosomal protein S5
MSVLCHGTLAIRAVESPQVLNISEAKNVVKAGVNFRFNMLPVVTRQ